MLPPCSGAPPGRHPAPEEFGDAQIFRDAVPVSFRAVWRLGRQCGGGHHRASSFSPPASQAHRGRGAFRSHCRGSSLIWGRRCVAAIPGHGRLWPLWKTAPHSSEHWSSLRCRRSCAVKRRNANGRCRGPFIGFWPSGHSNSGSSRARQHDACAKHRRTGRCLRRLIEVLIARDQGQIGHAERATEAQAALANALRNALATRAEERATND